MKQMIMIPHTLSSNHPSTHTHTHAHTQTKQNKKQKKQILAQFYTLCDINTEDTIRRNIDLMTSTSKVYIPYRLGTTAK